MPGEQHPIVLLHRRVDDRRLRGHQGRVIVASVDDTPSPFRVTAVTR